MHNIRYPAARVQRVIHAAPQFRPIKRGARRKGLLRTYECKNGDRVEIALFEELDIGDQEVLLCVLSMARAENRGAIASQEPQSHDIKALRSALELDGIAATQDAIILTTSAYEVLIELGRTADARSYKWLRKSIVRLSRVSFLYTGQNGWWTFNLLSAQGLQAGTKKLSICINPLSARAVLADKGGYTLVHRPERAKLRTEEARALHSVLCGLVDMGAERVLRVDMLADKVYARYEEEISAEAIRLRRKAIIQALFEIDGLDYWSCSIIGRGVLCVVKIKRKRRSDVS
jgi:hypothetical protein